MLILLSPLQTQCLNLISSEKSTLSGQGSSAVARPQLSVKAVLHWKSFISHLSEGWWKAEGTEPLCHVDLMFYLGAKTTQVEQFLKNSV